MKKKISDYSNIFQKDIGNGSITVEAAFVMPIVVFTIFALIYLAFYLHDMCRIQAVMDKTLHKAGISVKHEGDLETGAVAYENISDRGVFYLIFGDTEEEETQIREYLTQQLSEGLFLSTISSIDVDVGKFNMDISIKADTEVSLPGVRYLFEPVSITEIEGSYPVHDPAETIRRTEVILDTGSSIKGVDELKEKIEDFLGQ